MMITETEKARQRQGMRTDLDSELSGQLARMSGDVEDHIDNLLKFLVLRQLYQIKYEILKFFEPEKEFVYNIRILTDWSLWKHFIEGYFISKVRDDEDYREIALFLIMSLIKKVETPNFQPFA